MIDSPIQMEILNKCKFYKTGARYSELMLKHIDKDLYNYHLKMLVDKYYLEKKDNLYILTEIGKGLVTNLDDETNKLHGNYKVSVYLCPVIDNKILLHRRLKHPQYGYEGLISGKMWLGENILDAAKREMMEETNLKANFRIIGNLRQIRKNREGKVIEDGVFYVCYTDKVIGKLIPKTPVGEYFWIDMDKINTLKKIFKPSVEVIILEIKKRIKRKELWDSKFIYEFEPKPEKY